MIFEQNFSYLSGMLKSSWTPQTKFHFPPVFWADSRKKKVSKSRQITSAWMESTTGKWENAPWTDPRNVLHEWKLLLARWNQCFCWYVYLSKPPLQLKSYGNPPVFCQRLFALQLPPFSQKFRRKRLSFPGSLNKSILLFWLSTKRERERERKKKKKKAPPIFATHVLHHWIVAFMSFWIGCVFHCLGRSTREQTAPQNTNYSINFSELCVCVKTGKHMMGLQL